MLVSPVDGLGVGWIGYSLRRETFDRLNVIPGCSQNPPQILVVSDFERSNLQSVMFKLTPYDVVFWIRVSPSSHGLHERIIAQAGRRPDESAVMQGMRDMHWGFNMAEEAVAFADSFLEIAASDEVVLLSVNASQNDQFGRKVYKDTRASNPSLV